MRGVSYTPAKYWPASELVGAGDAADERAGTALADGENNFDQAFPAGGIRIDHRSLSRYS